MGGSIFQIDGKVGVKFMKGSDRQCWEDFILYLACIK